MLVVPSNSDKLMRLAITLAKKGIGRTSPNPLVGAVVVKDGEIISEGYHRRYGGPHAEINALTKAGSGAKGADIFINLEPCCHYGKTSPCFKELISRGISKVHVGMVDPNPVVSGKGIKYLRDAGVGVEVGILEDDCKRLNEAYIKYITTKVPFVTLKLAATLDGKMATDTGESQWITEAGSRKRVHKMRGTVDGIIVGVGTILKDNPQLTNRLSEGTNPNRIILDSELRIPFTANVLKSIPDTDVFIATTYKAPLKKVEKLRRLGVKIIFLPLLEDGIDLKALMKELGKYNLMNILIEGGTKLATSAIKSGVVDKLSLFLAPKIMGGADSAPLFLDLGVSSLQDVFKINGMRSQKIGNDILIEGYFNGNGRARI
jgi:diaminohydroxyphosphoribosylaminopyrimidine deaminase/5-amino-6-(5-phosphoribosylamino)uracil reductase